MEDRNNPFSSVAATEKIGLFGGNHEEETKNAKADGWGTTDRQTKARLISGLLIGGALAGSEASSSGLVALVESRHG